MPGVEREGSYTHNKVGYLLGGLAILFFWLNESRRGTLAHTTVHIETYFDTSEAKTGFGIGDSRASLKRFSLFESDSLSMENPDFKLIVLAPIRRMQGELLGLLLMPTMQEKGQFTRVGQFCYRKGFGSETARFKSISSSTDIVDDKFFISRERQGYSTEYTFSIV